jgi:hypothetical protein
MSLTCITQDTITIRVVWAVAMLVISQAAIVCAGFWFVVRRARKRLQLIPRPPVG